MLLDRCPWYIAGPVLGVVIIGLRATVNKPLGALGGYIDVTEHVTRPSRLGFSAFLLAGIMIGGALFTLTTGSSLPSPSYSGLLPADPVLQLGILLVAGLAMGVGARTTGGCTFGPRTHRHVARFSRQHRGGDDLLRYGGRIGARMGVARRGAS